ncbi:CBS domain-containing protein [Vibrio palustris]|uniref:Inosine-5'-monophosphate dehydrogenase n=1 Tax=Vibrio palustris TaxID=1918946 RepID=A0A1R4B8J2_9VIBR|nr:CBS domain-containing protein [Vibrio palustris]SJL85171.1 Inosine-5'-monophosphate dehydrogenase [Vibrio palustris]
MIKVEEMMTRNPHTLSRTHTIADARNMMDALDIRHIPIIDNNQQLQGVISQRDILAAQVSTLQQHRVNPSEDTTQLYEIMHTNVMTVAPQAGLKESALYMHKHRIGCLLVVNKGQLEGIITDTDFIAIAINLLEIQENIEPEETEAAD